MKDKLKTNILLVLIFLIEIFAVSHFFSCPNFLNQAHYSPFDLQLRLIENIHNDGGIPLWQVRLFHNKVEGSLFDIFAQYLQFWNIPFLANFLSLAGVLGLGAGMYAFFTKKKNVVLNLLFVYLLVVPFIEIFASNKLPYLFRLILIVVPFLFWSLVGYWYLLKKKKISSKIVDVLLLVSLWYLLAFPVWNQFCILK